MSKAQITDIIIIAIISGVVAILTSFMGISGTIIGAVVTSFLGELLKKYLKDPIIDDMKNGESNHRINTKHTINNYKPTYTYPKTNVTVKRDNSVITTKILFLYPLIVILLIELIHFLGAVGLIPYDIFLGLESITNWTLFRTIGFALIIMGLYPLFSNKIDSKHGVILIIVGFIELVIGFADVNTQASIIYSLFSSVKEYINIAIILAILYTVLTVPDDLENNRTHKKRNGKNTHHFNNDNNVHKFKEETIYDNEDDEYYY